MEPYDGPIITVAAAKGGVGKSTLCANLGYCWRRFGLKTMIIDLDPQGSVTRFIANTHRETSSTRLASLTTRDAITTELKALAEFSLEKERSVVHLLNGNAVDPVEHHGIGLVGMHPDSLKLIRTLHDAHTQNLFLEAFNLTLEKYQPDVVIFDTPPSHTDACAFAIKQSTHIVIPLEVSEEGVRGAVFIEDQRQASIRNEHMRKNLSFDVQLAGVVPMNVYRSNFCKRYLEVAKHFFGDAVTSAIDHATSIGESCCEGLPVIAYEDKMKNIEKEYTRKGLKYTKSGIQILNVAQTLGVRIGILEENSVDQDEPLKASANKEA